MFKTKLLAHAAIAILVGGTLFGVAGQKMPAPPEPIDPPVGEILSGTYTSKVNANEISAGEANDTAGQTFGATFVGATSGDLSGFLFVSMNYTLPGETVPEEGPTSAVVGPSPGLQMSKIKGGSWSKLIFRDGKYLGSVYGRILGGTMFWSVDGLSASMSLDFAADNGTGSFVGNRGKGAFDAILDRSTRGAPNVAGVLTLNY